MEECGDVGVDIGDGGGGGDGIVRSKEVFKVGGGGVDNASVHGFGRGLNLHSKVQKKRVKMWHV